MLKKGLFGGALVIIAIVAGFIFLLRGCLSRYDERAAITPALYFEKNGKAVVFTIIKYGKTTSYSSGPKGTFKSLNTNYYIQSNDAETGVVIATKKIKHHSDVKFHPVTVMGTGNGKAWVFIGEVMAFDPFTLEELANREMIEAKNPQLKEKMPQEKSYYTYNSAADEIMITATDGMKYTLSTTSLLVIAIDDEDVTQNPFEIKIKALKKDADALEEKYRTFYERYRSFNKLYSEKKISYAAYIDSGRNFNQQQDGISKMKTNIREEISELENLKRSGNDRKRDIDNLNDGSISYTDISVAADTFNGKWYGLQSPADLEDFYNRFTYKPVYTETARNKLYSATLSQREAAKKTSDLIVGVPEKINDAVYLQGGFLLSKTTALPIHLKNDDGFIICYRQKVGRAGNVILARIDLKGNIRWTLDTKLTEFKDWLYTGKQLIILGNDNKEISSSDANLLLCINMQTGKATAHDYFTGKMSKE